MPFQISPGVNVTEIDLTTMIPAVATTEGAIAGVFKWGPVEQRVLIESENELVQRFGRPDSDNAETFFTAASFLAYGNKLYVTRAANTSLTYSAVANTGAVANVAANAIKNIHVYENGSLSYDANVYFVARAPGALGNSLKISICESANAYKQVIFTAANSAAVNTSAITTTFTTQSNSITVQTADGSNASAFSAVLSVGDIIRVGNGVVGTQELKISSKSVTGSNVGITFTSAFKMSSNLVVNSTTYSNLTFDRYWEFYNSIDRAPGTSDYTAGKGGSGDEMHLVVVDEDGKFTGVPGSTLEVFPSMSRASDAISTDGGNIYYKNVINDNSNYIWWTNHFTTASNTGNLAATVVAIANATPYTWSMASGVDGESEANVAIGVLATGYDQYKSAEDIDVSLILAGKARGGSSNTQMANYIIDNICEFRKDCVAFISPEKSYVVRTGSVDMAADVVTFRNSVTNSSYAILDSGYKYMYDRYNDVYRYVPLNGDIAGLTVRTDSIRDPWWSPAGYNRGIIKNVIKLPYNPHKADRDILYKSDINPVVTFPGQGTLLFGDKTLLGKPSAFDRINVRRLFIVLEKAIATAAKYMLFEFNDAFTRAQFRNMVEPFLRDVMGRRGIYDFRVVCDETNNTPERIDRNEFWGDIYIKPARSINFIQLNFVAVRTGVEFSEVVGQF